MSYANQYWTTELVLDACRALDQERIAAGNMVPLKTADIRDYEGLLDIPSTETTREYVGGINNVNEELGRVTTRLALAWTMEEWEQNAQWARDVLDESGVRSYTLDQINPLSVAGLVPNSKAIEKVWGSIPNYRIKTTVDTQPKLSEADSWSKEESVVNGKEYAAYLGEELGFPIMPVEDDIYYSSKEGRTPNQRQIESIHGSFEQYKADLGFVTNEVVRGWSDQQWIDNFNWLKDVWVEHGREITSLTELFNVVGRLHIGPPIRLVVERWGTMINYGKHVGFENNNRKSQLSDEGVMRAAIQVFVAKGENRALTMDDLDEHPDVGINMLVKRFKGLAKVNLRIGYINGVRGWSRDKLLWWSITSFMAEHGHAPDSGDLARCSKASTGPSNVKIYQVFDHSMDVYRGEIKRAQEWLDWQMKNRSIKYRGPSDGFSPTFIKAAIARNAELFHTNRDIEPKELDVFYKLQKANISVEKLVPFMQKGISFSEPMPQLRELADILSAGNMLSVFVLKRLEPYIMGLAPPEVDMSWADFVSQYRDGLPHRRN